MLQPVLYIWRFKWWGLSVNLAVIIFEVFQFNPMKCLNKRTHTRHEETTIRHFCLFSLVNIVPSFIYDNFFLISNQSLSHSIWEAFFDSQKFSFLYDPEEGNPRTIATNPVEIMHHPASGQLYNTTATVALLHCLWCIIYINITKLSCIKLPNFCHHIAKIYTYTINRKITKYQPSYV